MPANCRAMGPAPYSFPAMKPPPGYGPVPAGVMMNGKTGQREGSVNNNLGLPHENDIAKQNMMTPQYHQKPSPPVYSVKSGSRSHQPMSQAQFTSKLSPIPEIVPNAHTQVNKICTPYQHINTPPTPVQWTAQNYVPPPVFYPQGHPGIAPLSGNSPIYTNENHTPPEPFGPGPEPFTRPSQFTNLPPPYQASQPVNISTEYTTGAPIPQYHTIAAPSGSLSPEFYKPTCFVSHPFPQQFQFNLYPPTQPVQHAQFNPVLNHCNVQFNTQGPSESPKQKVSSYEYNGTVYYYYNSSVPKNRQHPEQEETKQHIQADDTEDNKTETAEANLTSAEQQKSKRKWKKRNKN